MAEAGGEVGEAVAVGFEGAGDVAGLGGDGTVIQVGGSGSGSGPSGSSWRSAFAHPPIQPGLGWQPAVRAERFREGQRKLDDDETVAEAAGSASGREELDGLSVVGEDPAAEPPNPSPIGQLAELVEHSRTDALALVIVVDGDRYLGYFRLVLETDVAGESDSGEPTGALDSGCQGLVLVVVDVGEIAQLRFGELRLDGVKPGSLAGLRQVVERRAQLIGVTRLDRPHLDLQTRSGAERLRVFIDARRWRVVVGRRLGCGVPSRSISSGYRSSLATAARPRRHGRLSQPIDPGHQQLDLQASQFPGPTGPAPGPRAPSRRSRRRRSRSIRSPRSGHRRARLRAASRWGS